MSEILENSDNLRILKSVVSGDSVVVNYSDLARRLSKSRSTIQDHVEKLIEHKIIRPPSFPFLHLLTAYPLLLLTNMDIPDCVECQPRIRKWISEDPKIIAAYKFRQGEYGTLIFTLHKSLSEAHEWMSQLPEILENIYHVEKRHATFNSNTIYLSNELLLKYNPSTSINILERDSKKSDIILNGCSVDRLDLAILRLLITGKGVKYNKNQVNASTGLDSRTIEKRIDLMLKNKILLNPVCRFYDLLVPPDYLLSYVLVHLEQPMDNNLNGLMVNDNIPAIWKTIYSKYNLLMFYVHTDMYNLYGDTDDNRESTQILEKAQAKYLTHNPIKGFNPKKLSLQYIENELRKIEKRDSARG